MSNNIVFMTQKKKAVYYQHTVYHMGETAQSRC